MESIFLHPPTTWRDLLDIVLVTIIFYQIILWIRNTRTLSAIYSITFFSALYLLADYMGLYSLTWLLEHFFNSLFLVIVILFHQDIRRALSSLGSHKWFGKTDEAKQQQEYIQILSETLWYLSQRRIGALIVLENADSLANAVQSGVQLNAAITQQLLVTIFIPGTPLHDGAVIVKDNTITLAACILPLANISGQNFGTRHRAAIGITEETDAIVLVVSEERGTVSIAHKGTLRAIDPTLLAQELETCKDQL